MADAKRVLVADEMSKTAVEIMSKAGITVDVNTGLAPNQLAEIIGNYDGLAIRSATKVTPAILERASRLKIVGRAGVGVDNIDVVAATGKKVQVINTPQGNAIAAGELAIGLMFALARKIPMASASTKKAEWEKKKFMGVEITGKTLGVVGLGNIGRTVAERGVGLKMNVIGYDPYPPAASVLPAGVKVVPFADVVAQSDFISLHLPLVEGTKNLFNADTLAKMKKGSFLINCARGGIVNETALYEALKSEHLGGAAVDVFETEPPGATPLFTLENVIVSPHIGASTKEAQTKVAIELAEVFVDFFNNGKVRNAVNRL